MNKNNMTELSYDDFVEKYIDDDKLMIQILTMTKNYIYKLFKGVNTHIFDINMLAQSAKENFIKSMYDYYPYTNMDFDEACSELVLEFEYTLFYNKYPILKQFGDMIASLIKGEYPNGDCMNDHENNIGNLSFNYEYILFKYTYNLVNKS